MADDQLKDKPLERLVVSPEPGDSGQELASPGDFDPQGVSSAEGSTSDPKGVSSFESPTNIDITLQQVASELAIAESIKNSTDSNKKDPMLGTTIAGQYLVDSLIGKGGMGSVYKATDLVLERTVALKVINKGLTGEALMRFQQEGRTLGKMNHPNVASVFIVGTSEDGTPYMVMEYIDGEPLSTIIKNDSPLNPDWIIHISSQVLGALGSIHSSSVIHRDLKPENILITRNDRGADVAKLVDFGIARDTQQAQALTKTGEIMGSPLYMSPEQCAGKPLDAQSDIYSFACILFEMFSGSPPFKGDSILETLHSHNFDRRPPLPKQYKHVDKVLMKALSIKKEDRFNTTQIFADELVKAYCFHWRKMLLQDPTDIFKNMNTRRQGKHLERTMIIFWSLLVSIFVFSIASISLAPPLKYVATTLVIASVIGLLTGMFWKLKIGKQQ